MIDLRPHQEKALELLKSGMILYGSVGSGKSLTSVAYYKKYQSDKPLYIITTARKRDELDWLRDLSSFGIHPDTVVVDSWNNIPKYTDATGGFFIFDEQRLVGRGAWAKAFLKIAKQNEWIVLSGTPGDTWLDYATIFIANGWYRDISDFRDQHVLYEPFTKYPKVRGYINVKKLEVYRAATLLEMVYTPHTTRHLNWIECSFDAAAMLKVHKDRWNIFDDQPVKDVNEAFRVMRKIANTDPSRLEMIRFLHTTHKKLIVFYNFNYELDILRTLADTTTVAEWNGHKKQPIPEGDDWIYLVQYVAGAEAWNCTTTNAMVLYSMTYSYKIFEQCQGRIDRMNTPYNDLYYYILVTDSVVDRAIKAALGRKESFNESAFLANPYEHEGETDAFYAYWG